MDMSSEWIAIMSPVPSLLIWSLSVDASHEVEDASLIAVAEWSNIQGNYPFPFSKILGMFNPPCTLRSTVTIVSL